MYGKDRALPCLEAQGLRLCFGGSRDSVPPWGDSMERVQPEQSPEMG